MPTTWRVRVIGHRLAAEGFSADVRACDIYALEGEERHAVLDAMVREGAEPPFVIVSGTVACAGEIDMDAVLSAARA